MQIIFSATEEVGWRGYLLPQLLTLGKTRALLVSGFCHGLWHLPGILIFSTYHAEGNRILVVTLFLVTLTAAGVLYGYVRILGDSLWPAVLTHALVNTTWAFWRVMTVAIISAEALEYWSGETGIFMVILITGVAGWLLYRINRQPQTPTVDTLATVTQ
jgi:membrane protease YdiL (CAAX protease family)